MAATRAPAFTGSDDQGGQGPTARYRTGERSPRGVTAAGAERPSQAHTVCGWKSVEMKRQRIGASQPGALAAHRCREGQSAELVQSRAPASGQGSSV